MDAKWSGTHAPWWRGVTHRDLEDELLVVVGGLKGIEDGRQLGTLELDWSEGSSVSSASSVPGWSSARLQMVAQV